MTRNQIARLFTIAVKSRQRMEALAKERGAPDDLRGMCALAALDLQRSLIAAGLPGQFAVGQNHCFCLVGSFIIDTTATQFTNVDPVEGVWITDSDDPEMVEDPGVWKIEMVFDTEQEVLSAAVWHAWRWPEDERPHALLTAQPAPALITKQMKLTA